MINWSLISDGIDLLNVSFEGEAAPDRVTARTGLNELNKIAPLRRYVIPMSLLPKIKLCFRLPLFFLLFNFSLLGKGKNI